MRVAHVTHTTEHNVQGFEKHVLNLASAQRDRGLSPVAVTDGSGLFTEACEQHGIPVVIVPSLKPRPGGRPAEQAIQDLTTHFEAVQPDLVHCHTLTTAVSAVRAGNRIQIPCVVTLHSTDNQHYLLAARSEGLRFTAIVLTKAVFDELRMKGMPEGSVYYVPNGTHATAPEGLNQRRGPHDTNLIWVGSLGLRKGPDVAILAMAELRRRLGQSCPVLNIYGHGRDDAYMKEMATVLGLDGTVRFHGFQPDILAHCPSTDIFILSSRSETAPLVLLEAMSRGMPIVATDVGEVPQMLPDQRYGRIVPPTSIVALADAIESQLSDIAAGKFDPELVIERHRSLYTIDIMAERIGEVYQEILPASSVAH